MQPVGTTQTATGGNQFGSNQTIRNFQEFSGSSGVANFPKLRYLYYQSMTKQGTATANLDYFMSGHNNTNSVDLTGAVSNLNYDFMINSTVTELYLPALEKICFNNNVGHWAINYGSGQFASTASGSDIYNNTAYNINCFRNLTQLKRLELPSLTHIASDIVFSASCISSTTVATLRPVIVRRLLNNACFKDLHRCEYLSLPKIVMINRPTTGGTGGHASGTASGNGGNSFTHIMNVGCFEQFGRYTFAEKSVIPTMEIRTRGLATQMNLSTTFYANTFARINSSVAAGTNGTAADSWQVTMVFNQPTTANNWNTNVFQNSFLPLINVFVNYADAAAVGVNNSWRGLIFGTVTIMPPM